MDRVEEQSKILAKTAKSRNKKQFVVLLHVDLIWKDLNITRKNFDTSNERTN